jgi:hypothetical protein
MASKVFTIIYDAELGKPVALPYIGRNLVRDDNGAAGRGYGKKRMPVSNRPDIGYALIRKDADFPLVFHCMNRDKPKNVRKSITPNGEMLTDT